MSFLKSLLNKSQYLTLFIIALVIFCTIIPSIGNFSSNSEERQTSAIAEIINHALVQCYALEGSYPPDLQYLSDHYGIILNEEQFYYDYSVDGSNLMPILHVIEK